MTHQKIQAVTLKEPREPISFARIHGNARSTEYNQYFYSVVPNEFTKITSMPSEKMVPTNTARKGVLFAKVCNACRMVCGLSLLITKALRALTQPKMKYDVRDIHKIVNAKRYSPIIFLLQSFPRETLVSPDMISRNDSERATLTYSLSV